MRKLMTSINKRSSALISGDSSTPPAGDSPQANVARGIKLFCESGGPNSAGGQGEEVLHLPVIVEAAESSPEAAKEAAAIIRKFLSKDNNKRPYVQYNAIMLIRILSDNPGKTFTRNMNEKFIATTKDLFRTSADPSVQQMLAETLTDLGKRKDDEGLQQINAFWASEQEKLQSSWPRHASQMGGGSQHTSPAQAPNQQSNYFARNHRIRSLPAPGELAARIEEAKTSAKLLQQVVRSTPANEIINNDLVKEFADRCQSASRSIQGYINATNPAPDDDTLLTLIETNDQLSSAMSKHQRAVLSARKAMAPPTPTPTPPTAVPLSNQQAEPANPFADPNQEQQSMQPPLHPTSAYGQPPPVVSGALAPTALPAQTPTPDPHQSAYGAAQLGQYSQQQQFHPQYNYQQSSAPPLQSGQYAEPQQPQYESAAFGSRQPEAPRAPVGPPQHSPVSPVQEQHQATPSEPREPIAYRY
ncbi:MAG: hypothetical protein M1814_000369 [Vezdaea aestivalis]|nr:MAG: hypothetical protein M1814_000369 [Vezdaea aestivalis]